MCEIVVVVVDKVNDDFYKDCQCYKAGDVICAQPDGWTWGKLDQSNPDWRILKFPGVDLSAFAQCLLPQEDSDPKNPSRMLLRRAVKFDLTTIDPAFVSDAKRTAPALSVQIAAADVSALTVTKPMVADPAVIGPQPVQPANVIG